ncbi:MAG: hypothetical protein GC158_02795 [Cyanobacteria bacterium RI_101]|nr:hypothetical protein [Cyanobacteria bacterium RI_101]
MKERVKHIKKAGAALLLPCLWLGTTHPVFGACPGELTDLIPPLLADLPSYVNRVAQRRLGAEPLQTYLLIAGEADFNPLPLPQRQFPPQAPDTTRQVFFTTLERHYDEAGLTSRQNFYRSFWVETSGGWQLALLYGQLNAAKTNPIPEPPQFLNDSDLAEAVRLWLRDCQAPESKKS